LVFCISIATVNSLGCQNQKGKDVDWFMIFKMPNGNDYFYADDDTGSTLEKSADQLDDTSSSPIFFYG